MKRKSNLLLKKSFVFILLSMFLASSVETAWAQNFSTSLSPQAFSIQQPTIPLELGRVIDSYVSSPNRKAPLLIHLEDAHAHLGTQQKIREILHYLNETLGIDTVFIEGAKGRIDPQLFNIFPDPAINVKAAEHWMKKGYFSGAEVFAIEMGDKIRMEGIEEKRLYQGNLKLFREVHGMLPRVQPRLEEWARRIRKLKDEVYLGDLKRWDKARQDFQAEKRNLLDYALFLTDTLRKYKPDFIPSSHVKKLLSLERLSGSVSDESWRNEWNQIRNLIRKNIPGAHPMKRFLLTRRMLLKQELPAPRNFFEILVTASERFHFSLEPFMQLPQAAAYFILRKEIEAPELMKELSALDEELAQILLETRQEKGVHEQDQSFELFQKLVHLELSREEWQKILDRRDRYPDEIFHQALKFYELAFQREDVLVRNALRKMKAMDVSRAVIITGGFHGEGIRAKLKQKNLSYWSIRPQARASEEGSAYLDVMLGRNKILPRDMISETHTLAIAALLERENLDPSAAGTLDEIVIRTVSQWTPRISPSEPANANSLGSRARKVSKKSEPKNGLSSYPKKVAVWGAADMAKTTSAFLADQGISVTVFDSKENIERARMLNHEPTRNRLYQEGVDKKRITEKDVYEFLTANDLLPIDQSDMNPADKQEARRKLASEKGQRFVVENYDVIIIDARDFRSEDRKKYLDKVNERSDGFGRALEALRASEKAAEKSPSQKTFVLRSPVPPGLTDYIMGRILKESGYDEHFSVVYAPDVLRSGSQIFDMKKHPVILGLPRFDAETKLIPRTHPNRDQTLARLTEANERAKETLRDLFKPAKKNKFIVISAVSAELSRLGTLALYFTRLLFYMEVARLVHELGANIDEIIPALRADRRIGPLLENQAEEDRVSFGIGGKARELMRSWAQEMGLVETNGQSLEATKMFADWVKTLNQMNEDQIRWFEGIIETTLKSVFGKKGGISGQRVALLGISFKGDSGSLLASPALDLVDWMIQENVSEISIYDPRVKKEEFDQWIASLPETRRASLAQIKIYFVSSAEKAMENADFAILAANHQVFRSQLKPEKVKAFLKNNPFFDGTNMFDPFKMQEAGVNYVSIARPRVGPNFEGIPDRRNIKRVRLRSKTRAMKVAVFGVGQIGLPVAAGLSEQGHLVTGIDVNKEKIEELNRGEIPFDEPGLENLVTRNKNKKHGALRFVHSPENTALGGKITLEKTFNPFDGSDAEKDTQGADVIYLAVPTDRGEDGEANLTYLQNATRTIGYALQKGKFKRKVIAVKSTVPPKAFAVMKRILEEEFHLKEGIHFDLASNPEFLREGSAVKDLLHSPDRTVFGVESVEAAQVLLDLWAPLIKKLAGQGHHHRVYITDRISAPLVKYMANGFLAASISFSNVLAWYAEKLDANYPEEIRPTIASDPRNSPYSFIYPGIFGGYCFPKDTEGLRHEMKGSRIIDETLKTNQRAKKTAVEKIKNDGFLATSEFGSLEGRQIGFLGQAFKKDTDDVRETPSLPIVLALLKLGARLILYDPLPRAQRNFKKALALKAISEMPLLFQAFDKSRLDASAVDKILEQAYGDKLRFVRSIEEAAKDSHLLAIISDSDEFKKIDLNKIRGLMKTGRRVDSTTEGIVVEAPVIFDLRNLLTGRKTELQGNGYLTIFTGRTWLKPGAPVTGVAASLGTDLSASPSARRLVREWLGENTGGVTTMKEETERIQDVMDMEAASLGLDARGTALRIVSNDLPGELVFSVEDPSARALGEKLKPVALALRAREELSVTVLVEDSEMEEKVRAVFANLKVSPEKMNKQVAVRRMARPDSQQTLERYLIGRAASLGEGRIVMVGDSDELPQIPGLRKISWNEISTGNETLAIEAPYRLVAEVAALSLGLDLLSSVVDDPQGDKLAKRGSLYMMRQSFLAESLGRWVREVETQMKLLISA